MTTYPPMVDLPQYVAQVAMFNSIAGGDWSYSHLFETKLFTPFIFALGLLWLLDLIFGMVGAAKAVVALAVFCMPTATAILLKECKSDPNWSWLVVPACYGSAFSWGLLNFLVACPIGIFFLVFIFRYSEKPSFRVGVSIFLLVTLLFFSHILIFAFFGLVAGLLILWRVGARGLWATFLTSLPLLGLVPIVLLWGATYLGTDQGHWPTQWKLGWHRLVQLPYVLMGASVSPFNWVLIVGLFAVPVIGGARPTKRIERYLPLSLCVAVLLFAPFQTGGAFLIYQRFAIFLVPCYLWIFDPANTTRLWMRRRIAEVGAAAIALTWIATSAVRFSGYERESEDFREILAQMVPGQRVLSLPLVNGSRYSVDPIYLHYAVWYQARGGGLVDVSYASFQSVPVQYRPEYAFKPGIDFVWNSHTFNWEDHKNSGYRYILARGYSGKEDAPLRPRHEDGFELRAKRGMWWLYEVSGSIREAPR